MLFIGPYGINLLSEDIGFSIFGTIGLLYLMFLAGLEIDFNDFLKNRKQGTIFGILTFLFPSIIAFPVFYWVFKIDLLGSLLISAMLASHTLVSYPILGRLGITNHRIVTILIAGTIIADTIVLLILGVVSDSVQGDLSPVFWLKTFFNFLIFFVYIVKVLPLIAKWFFKNQETENSIQYIFVLSVIFISATIAEMLKIEPLIGAFFAGLSLNRLIVRTSPLMNRIVFIGNTLFIPFFLISIGMMVNLSAIFSNLIGILILIVLIIIAVAGKFIAAWTTQKMFSFSVTERNLLFGLSTSRAASAIAVMIVANNINLVSDVVLNNTIILILVTCLISSIITHKAGKKIASEIYIEPATDETPERILVSISNPVNIEKLIEFSVLIKEPKSDEAIYPITVLPDSQSAAEKNEQNRKLLDKALIHGSAIDAKIESITRIDINPLYSWKSEVNSMNVCWVVGCKAGNPDLGILKFGLCNKSKFVGIP